MDSDQELSVPKKIGVAIVELLVSTGLSYKTLPFPPVAGYERIFIGLAFFGTLVGAVLSLRSSFSVALVIWAIVVAAVMSLVYSTIISGGGLSYWWTYVAMAVYFGIFSGAFYAISELAKELLKRM
jgi:hypothetical protein